MSPREFVNFYHWRLLEDGSVLYVGFSVNVEEKPARDDPVRGWDTVVGYMFRPTEDGKGTDVHMIFDVSSSRSSLSYLFQYRLCEKKLHRFFNLSDVRLHNLHT